MGPNPPPRDLPNVTGATECAHGISLKAFCQACGVSAAGTVPPEVVTMVMNHSELRVTKVTISEAAGDATRLVWEGWCVCAGNTPVTPAHQSRAVAEQQLAQLLSAVAAAAR